jgi:SAM-dependent methyltransferase
MPEPLDAALAEVRGLLLDDRLVRAVAAGRRRNTTPRWTRVELRPVSVRAGRRLQLVEHDGTRPRTRNVAAGDEAATAVDAVLGEPFGNWYVETAERTVALRVTKSGQAQVHRAVPAAAARAASEGPEARSARSARAPEEHDRARNHLLDPGDPIYNVIGGSAAKRRQVDAFLRALAATLDDERLPQPLRVVDLGCGNAYLTFAAYRYLTGRGLDVEMVGVDVRDDQRHRNTELAHRLGWADHVRFRAGTILDSDVDGADLVLALHACDTATDEALARALRWRAEWTLAAPCCHHDIAAQLRRQRPPAPYEPLTRHGILRERFADVLTDALRAALLRLHGYRVDVVEFVDSAHTPRNVLLRARRTGAPPTAEQRAEYRDLISAWQITPRLATLCPPFPAA